MNKKVFGVAVGVAILYVIYLFMTYETLYDLTMDIIRILGSALVLFACYIGQNRNKGNKL